jgi:methionine-gamma-lyase
MMMSSSNLHILTQIIKSAEGKNFSDVRIPGIPIFQTSNYLYEDVDIGTDILLSKKPGHIYTRYSNPTVDALNEIMTDLENAQDSLSFASGMAAISSSILAFSYIYGGTFTFFQNQLSRFNISVTFVDPRDQDAIQSAIKSNTKILYTEPLSNPTLISSDILFWRKIAAQNKCKLFIDNTFTPPPIFRPLDWGVDVVLHSATKYLGGHSDLLGGVVCASKEDIELIRPVMKTFGPIIAPIIAWLLIRGIRTLGVRIERQCENAFALANFLNKHPKINRVFYPGLEQNPQFSLAQKQYNNYTGMLAFEVQGGWEAAKSVMKNLKTILFTVSLGDIASLICHPASTSHVYLTQAERDQIGITDGLLRLSVGIEHIDDLKRDLKQALEKI